MRTPSPFFRALVALVSAFVLVSVIPIQQIVGAAVAHVQTGQTYNNTDATTAVTGSLTFSAGGLAILSLCEQVNEAAPTGVALDATTAFTLDRSQSTTGNLTQVWSLPNVSAGAHTVTITWAANHQYEMIYFTEVSGANTTSPLDGAGAGATGTNGTPASGTYSAAGSSFWWAAECGGTTEPTAGTGWTIPTNGSADAAGSLTSAVEYQANPGSTSLNGDFASLVGTWTVAGVAYFVASSGPPPGSRGLRGVGR